MFQSRAQKFARRYEKPNPDSRDRSEELKREIGEEETFFSLMRHMAHENKLAVFSAIVILLFILGAVFAPFLTRYSYRDMDLLNRLSAPSAEHLFGTDEAGRDIFTRLLYGSRVSLLTGVVPTILSMLGGAVLDVIEDESGYYYTDARQKPVPEHIAALEELPEVTLLQHMAFCTYLSANEQLKTAIEASYLALSGKPNPYEIK